MVGGAGGGSMVAAAAAAAFIKVIKQWNNNSMEELAKCRKWRSLEAESTSSPPSMSLLSSSHPVDYDLQEAVVVVEIVDWNSKMGKDVLAEDWPQLLILCYRWWMRTWFRRISHDDVSYMYGGRQSRGINKDRATCCFVAGTRDANAGMRVGRNLVANRYKTTEQVSICYYA
ncbi:hypothetical protein WN51_03675 [Melipona quadrifasciata]|uniref:Uncharacterized protein n=1 Tax=Melipona quadrifasciata TaxID=166423 RepID=A0A0M8ZTG7_9HYME|nr:hypothetical protein WN51_03675 [Melipona quadrifasciata]